MTDDAYDRLPYPSKFFVQAFPDRLATLGTLFGMQPAAIDGCRVLELGCGNGSSLIAQAYLMPGAEFLGVDLSRVHIDEAEAGAKELGLRNVRFLQMDVMAMNAAELGTFDFIAAHGLFSWVPDEVRRRVLQLYGELLAEHGVGYISYNAYPGSHHREMVQRALRFRTRGVDEPLEKVRRAMEFLEFLAANTPDRGAHRAMLGLEVERHRSHSAADIFHDDLSDLNRAFYFHEVAAMLRENDLQFLAEAELHAMGTADLTAAAREFVEGTRDITEREQYLDLLRGRTFRQTLVCRAEMPLDRAPKPAVMDRFLVASQLRPQGAIDPAPGAIVRFTAPSGAGIEIDRPLAKSVLARLGAAWPRAAALPNLIETAAGDDSGPTDLESEADILRRILLSVANASTMVELHVHQPAGFTEFTARPRVNALARWQMRSADHVATTLGIDMRIEDEVSRRLLELLDGKRTRGALLDEIGKFIRSSHDIDAKKTILAGLPDWLDESLANLSRIGLFEA